jgi:hypothetical protein
METVKKSEYVSKAKGGVVKIIFIKFVILVAKTIKNENPKIS